MFGYAETDRFSVRVSARQRGIATCCRGVPNEGEIDFRLDGRQGESARLENNLKDLRWKTQDWNDQRYQAEAISKWP